MQTTVTSLMDTYFTNFGRSIAASMLHVYSEQQDLRNAIIEFHKDPKKFDARGMVVHPTAQDLRMDGPYTIAIGGAKAVGSDLLNMLISNFSRVCNWNLAHAFELLERFMKQTYAVLGWKDFSYWKQCDHPKLDSANLKDPSDYERYIIREKRNLDVNELRKRLYAALPRLQKDEIGNSSGSINSVSIWMTILEQLRHVIVHSSSCGLLRDLYERISKKTGIASSGELWSSIENTIQDLIQAAGRRREPKDAQKGSCWVSRRLDAQGGEGFLRGEKGVPGLGESP